MEHGFLDTGGSFTTIDVPGAGLYTNASGINDRGQIVGHWDFQSFLATPVVVPEPRGLLTLVPCLVALFAMAYRRKRASAGSRSPK